MTTISCISKDIFALVVAVMFTVLMVAGLADQGKNLFPAMLAFAAMVPIVGSAVVAIKRDWDNRDHHLSV
ncbi:MAG: hypothetical protein ACFE0K_04450 [Alcanivorax sp.]|uniref:hypothetical protein n=1 Tax=Alcanivorax sp. TaxID=1872427 RepID=UPI003DA78A5C